VNERGSEPIKLRPYQKKGVDFLQKRDKAVLADEMGLGKTLQALFAAAPFGINKSTAVLIVSPKSVRNIWVEELRKIGFTSNTYTEVLGTKLERTKTIANFFKRFKKDDLPFQIRFLLVTYDQVRLHREHLTSGTLLLPSKSWDVIILDEAHYIKNRKAKRTKAVKAIPAKRKWILTGTPLQNTPDELWSLLNFLDRKTYSSYWKFVYRYCNVRVDQFGHHIEGGRDLDKLAEEIQPFFLRRTKEEVAPELPPKIYQTYKVYLNNRQKQVYEELRKEGLSQLDTGAVDVTCILALFTRMRQICLSTELIGDENREPTPKEELILDLLRQNADSKSIVFTCFAKWARRLKRLLNKSSVALYLGDTSESERVETLYRFKLGDVQTLISTLQTGGVGLNLEFVDLAIFADKAWNPTHNQQAEDRLHRITTVRSPLIVSIVTKGTIEEYIETKLKHKIDWHKQVLEHSRRLLEISPKKENDNDQ